MLCGVDIHTFFYLFLPTAIHYPATVSIMLTYPRNGHNRRPCASMLHIQCNVTMKSYQRQPSHLPKYHIPLTLPLGEQYRLASKTRLILMHITLNVPALHVKDINEDLHVAKGFVPLLSLLLVKYVVRHECFFTAGERLGQKTRSHSWRILVIHCVRRVGSFTHTSLTTSLHTTAASAVHVALFLWSVNYTAILPDRTVRSGPTRSENYTRPRSGR